MPCVWMLQRGHSGDGCVNCIKLLGVILDDKLKWIEHISYIKNKIAKGMGIIQKA